SFYIKILFRQNASFQGEIEWISGKRKYCRYFRSVLEMVFLINEAMEIMNKPEANYKIRSWKENRQYEIKEFKN
ncbi:MAG: hypothetical protein ACOCQ5_04380, partial [Halanaerobiales bacterium]